MSKNTEAPSIVRTGNVNPAEHGLGSFAHVAAYVTELSAVAHQKPTERAFLSCYVLGPDGKAQKVNGKSVFSIKEGGSISDAIQQYVKIMTPRIELLNGSAVDIDEEKLVKEVAKCHDLVAEERMPNRLARDIALRKLLDQCFTKEAFEEAMEKAIMRLDAFLAIASAQYRNIQFLHKISAEMMQHGAEMQRQTRLALQAMETSYGTLVTTFDRNTREDKPAHLDYWITEGGIPDGIQRGMKRRIVGEEYVSVVEWFFRMVRQVGAFYTPMFERAAMYHTLFNRAHWDFLRKYDEAVLKSMEAPADYTDASDLMLQQAPPTFVWTDDMPPIKYMTKDVRSQMPACLFDPSTMPDGDAWTFNYGSTKRATSSYTRPAKKRRGLDLDAVE